MVSDRLFGPLLTTGAMHAATSDEAWLQAMLDVEAALARAQAKAGIIPTDAAEAITAACSASAFDVGALGQAAVSAGNPVIPLVQALAEAVPVESSGYVHYGATSQDILDTAAMVVARSASTLLLGGLEAVALACVALAERHRDSLMPGRTLLQQAVPVTFGLKAAGWLTATDEAAEGLRRLRGSRFAVQLGGAAGTLAAFGPHGGLVVGALAADLGLAEPALPWHAARGRVAELAAALAIVAGVMGKVGLDITLLAQTEVGEVAEAGPPGRGGSSAMPQKRNPIGAVTAVACARQAQGLASILLSCMLAEHERAAGAWMAEWEPLRALFAVTAGAVDRIGEALGGLEVDTARMEANLAASNGAVLAEAAVLALAPVLGRSTAHQVVEEASRAAAASGAHLRDVLAADARVAGILSPIGLDEVFDPHAILPAAGALIDRALEARRRLTDEER